MIDRLSTKIVVYTTSLVLFSLMIFSISSIITLISLRDYTLRKVEKVFKENAEENLKREVLSYAKVLKEDMESKKSVSFIFGEEVEKIFKGGGILNSISNIYGEISNVLDLRAIAVFNYRGEEIAQFPRFVNVDAISNFVKKLSSKTVAKKIVYYDFHKNKDGKVSYSFIYLGRDRNKSPIYIAFDYNPYSFYALVKTAQLCRYSQEYLWIINRDGLLIFAPPTKEHPLITLLNDVDLTNPENGETLAKIVKNSILKGETGVARYSFRGVDKFVGYTYIKEFGWGLGLTLPTEMFYKPIKELNRDINSKTTFTLALFGLFSSVIVLLAITASLILTRRIVEPINRTVKAVEAILEGDYSIRLPKSGAWELDELADAVNRLMDYFSKK